MQTEFFNENLISVIVPIYMPYKGYIKECIESVLHQNYDKYELILIVPKNQYSEFIKLGISDDHIVIIKSDFTTQSHNRNIGIKRAKGSHICFLDCDDILQRDFLKNSNNMINKYNCDLYEFNTARDKLNLNNFVDKPVYLDTDKNIKSALFSQYSSVRSNLNKTNVYSIWAKIFVKSIIDNYDISFNENTLCAEDTLFVSKYSLYVRKLLILNNYNAYFWRKNPNSIMNTFGPYFDINIFINEINSILSNIELKYRDNLKCFLYKNFKSRINQLILMVQNKHISTSKFCKYFKQFYGKNSIAYNYFVEVNNFKNSDFEMKILKENKFLFLKIKFFFCKNRLKNYFK